MSNRKQIVDWLLEGDVSTQYQTQKYLLEADNDVLVKLKAKIAKEGWGYELLKRQNKNGHWGREYYQPKWTCSHYTLQELRCLEIDATPSISRILDIIASDEKGRDGGINPSRSVKESDVCINGMVLDYASYFGVDEPKLHSIVDLIISLHMKDGGFNCRINRSGAVHSSLHSTICCLEGISEYLLQGYAYRNEELQTIEKQAIEFTLQHKLYKSDRTNEVISKAFTMLSYPFRWRYDVLRALVYFQKASVPYDSRMRDALDLLVSKRNKDGTWNVQAKHPGEVHFEMEKTGKESRWNSLRAMRVLEYYGVC